MRSRSSGRRIRRHPRRPVRHPRRNRPDSSVSSLNDQLLTLLLVYGYPVVAVVVFVGALGVPLPASAVLLAAGALALNSELDLVVLIPVATVSALAGDCTGYGVGRWVGVAALHRHGPRVGLTAARLRRVDAYLLRWSGPGVFLTRWLVTPLGPPVNLLTGAAGFPVLGFVLFAGLGETLWASGYLAAGYLLGEGWSTIQDNLGDAPWILLLALGGLIFLYLAYRLMRGQRRNGDAPPDSAAQPLATAATADTAARPAALS